MLSVREPGRNRCHGSLQVEHHSRSQWRKLCVTVSQQRVLLRRCFVLQFDVDKDYHASPRIPDFELCLDKKLFIHLDIGTDRSQVVRYGTDNCLHSSAGMYWLVFVYASRKQLLAKCHQSCASENPDILLSKSILLQCSSSRQQCRPAGFRPTCVPVWLVFTPV